MNEAAAPRRAFRPVYRLAARLEPHAAALCLAAAAFLGRMFLADNNSYWLDELYSVYVHGVSQPDVTGVIDSMRGIIHPPLYQIILFQWMQVFGDSELATRSLSNLYVFGATLALYAFAYKIYGRRVALVAITLFSFMAIPLAFALETRSYGQVLFTASASSLAFYYFVRHMPLTKTWLGFLGAPSFWALIFINTCALFTHYFTAFFLAAQGLFLLLYFVVRHRDRLLSMAPLRLILTGALPPLILVAIWGESMLQRFGSGTGGRFRTEDLTATMWEAFAKQILSPNLDLAQIVTLALLALTLAYFARALYLIAKGGARRAWFDLYVVLWLVLPACLAYAMFALVLHQEPYNERYFVYCTPALALLLTLSLFYAARLLDFATRKALRRNVMRPFLKASFAIGFLLAAMIALQKGYEAATRDKGDWRQIASMIAETVHADPAHTYFIYDTGFRPRSMLDYYFGAQHSGITSHAVLTAGQERRERFRFDRDARRLTRFDYIIVAFSHQGMTRYPHALAALEERYDEAYRVQLGEGRGYIVFSTHTADTHAAAAP